MSRPGVPTAIPSEIVGVVRDVMADFRRRLPDEKHAARDENQVAPGKAVPERFEDRRGEADDQRDRADDEKLGKSDVEHGG